MVIPSRADVLKAFPELATDLDDVLDRRLDLVRLALAAFGVSGDDVDDVLDQWPEGDARAVKRLEQGLAALRAAARKGSTVRGRDRQTTVKRATTGRSLMGSRPKRQRTR